MPANVQASQYRESQGAREHGFARICVHLMWHRLSILLATIANNVFLVFGTAFWGSYAIVSSLLHRWREGGTVASRMWSRGLLVTGGTRLDVAFEEEIDRDGVYVFLSNHQSLFDIPVLLWTLPVPTRFLAKRSLFRIPLFGRAMRVSGFIPVDRSDRSRARQSFEEAVQLLQTGTSVLVFPEETRSEDGKLLPFRRGAFLIAQKAKVPLVPVGLDGTREVRRKGSYWVRPGVVRVRYGSPIGHQARSAKERRQWMELVRSRIAALAGVGMGDSDKSAAERGVASGQETDDEKQSPA